MTLELGYIAAALTTVSFVPQVVKAHKTRHTGDLSLVMYSLFTLGVFLWMVYGIMIGAAPVIVANAVTFALSGYILYLKVKHG